MAARQRTYSTRRKRDLVHWLVLVGILAWGAWHAWDGWFPRAGVLEAHPDPTDHYYTYNKIVAVLCGVGAVFFAIWDTRAK